MALYSKRNKAVKPIARINKPVKVYRSSVSNLNASKEIFESRTRETSIWCKIINQKELKRSRKKEIAWWNFSWIFPERSKNLTKRITRKRAKRTNTHRLPREEKLRLAKISGWNKPARNTMPGISKWKIATNNITKRIIPDNREMVLAFAGFRVKVNQ